MFHRNIALTILLILLVGCASTKVTSYKDPAFNGAGYSYPFLHVYIEGLEHRLAIEHAFKEELSGPNLSVILGTDLFPPTRKLSVEDRLKIFLSSEADCLISIALKQGTKGRQEYEIRVIDKQSGKNVWVGYSSSKLIYDVALRTEDMSLRTMFRSLASSVVDRLESDGVIVMRIEENSHLSNTTVNY